MPTYDYYCESCNKVVEIFHSISDESKCHCPKCNKEMKRLISGGCGFILRGDGFYRQTKKDQEFNKNENIF